MREILKQLRLIQLFAHGAHNFCGRTPFHSDHEFFGEVYSTVEGDYDSVIERIIGLLGEEAVQYQSLHSEVAQRLQQLPSVGVKENSTFYQVLLQLDNELCSKISEVIKGGSVSPGTEQTLGAICESAEIRDYKIKQRIKK